MKKLGFRVESAIMVLVVMEVVAMVNDNNNVFQLCQDTRIQKSNGLTFDQISLLTINTTLETYSGYMVAFAGRKYAVRSPPTFVANSTCTVNGCLSCKRNPNLTLYI
ncbi:hypothetical protein AMTRI_Chr12g268870 [Amborella trichopoda]